MLGSEAADRVNRIMDTKCGDPRQLDLVSFSTYLLRLRLTITRRKLVFHHLMIQLEKQMKIGIMLVRTRPFRL